MTKRINLDDSLEGTSEPIEDKVTKARIERHLSDPNDKITEEDLLNIRTEFLPPEHSESKEPEAEAYYQEMEKTVGK